MKEVWIELVANGTTVQRVRHRNILGVMAIRPVAGAIAAVDLVMEAGAVGDTVIVPTNGIMVPLHRPGLTDIVIPALWGVGIVVQLLVEGD
jgi:hypothetical protein